MNNFNAIYSAIKTHSSDADTTGGKTCFNNVCRDANIPPKKIGFYLNSLKHLGFIDYSAKNRFIKLTDLGKQKEQLFENNEALNWRLDE